jgi:hypothetical protein
MVMMVSPASVNFNAPPETNFSRRSFIPVGEVGEFAKSSGEFTPEELEVIRKTPFLASRIEAAYDKGTIIGYRDSYKNRSDLVEARQAYNFAVNNPKEFYKSEFPAYLGSNDPTAATQLVQTLYDFGETPDNLKSLYESSLVSAPDYSMTYDEKVAINRATQGANDPLGLQQYLKPIFTTIGAIAGGPVGAAVMNSLLQLGETGKIDLFKETATAAATAYVGQEVFGPTVPEGGTPGVSEVYEVAPPGGTAAPLPPQSFGTGISGAGLTSAEMAALRGSAGYGETVQSLLNQDLAFVGADAAQLYNTTGSIPATQQNLLAAGVDPTMAAEASNLAALGGTGTSIASGLGTAFPGETVFTSEGLLSSGATLDPIAKDIAGITSTADSIIGITDALRGLNLANQLMSGQQQAGVGVPQQQAPLQTAGVDYSGILGLLGRQASMPNIQGLLGPAQIRYPNSLLG